MCSSYSAILYGTVHEFDIAVWLPRKFHILFEYYVILIFIEPSRVVRNNQ